jgi:3-oxoadipate enol-lactonase
MKTNYRLEGPADAPVVTLAHPLGATLEMWDAQVAALLPRYRVLRYDIRGHGGTEVPPGPYTLEQMADDLHALLNELAIRETHFVGLSMGGLIGMTAALSFPDRIRRLVLCDTTAQYGAAVEGMWHERLRVAETEGMTETLIERTMAIWFTEKFRAEHAAEVDRVRAMLRATDPRGYAASIRAIGFVTLIPRLGAIRSPTLVIVGEKDPGTPPAMAEVLHAKIPGARLVVLRGAMHCSAVEEAEAFNRAVGEFLAEGHVSDDSRDTGGEAS